MGYVNNALLDGEVVLYQGRISRLSLLLNWIVGAFFLLATVATWTSSAEPAPRYISLALLLMVLVPAFIKIYCTEMAITSKRIIYKTGLLSRKTIEINLNKIESIQVNQGLFGRMMGYGNLVMAGAGTPSAPIRGVDDPMLFRRKFLEATDQS